MNLKEFVSTVLVSIVEGIEDAQSNLDNRNSMATINPRGLEAQVALQQMKDGPAPSSVTFEVAVTAESADSAGMSGGIQVAGFKIGGQASNTETESRVSRISFEVPVHFPPGRVLKRVP